MGNWHWSNLHSLGHREIAFIRGPEALFDSAPRWRGVRKLADAKGLELDSGLIVALPASRDPMSGFEGGYQLTLDLLQRKHNFSALLAFDDMSALGAVRALGKAGFRVPEHCSVIGFDDTPPASICTPGLTTVRQAMEAMGSHAVTVLLEAIKAVQETQDYVTIHHNVLPEPVVRESTAILKSAETYGPLVETC